MNPDALDIRNVLRYYGWNLPAPKRGWYTIKCGAHDDSHGSCRINTDIGRVLCMGCGYSGDSIDIIRHEEGLDFRAAVDRYEAITGRSDSVLRSTGRRGSPLPRGSRDHTRDRSAPSTRLRRGA